VPRKARQRTAFQLHTNIIAKSAMSIRELPETNFHFPTSPKSALPSQMPNQRKSHTRPGPFLSVPRRARVDGWTPLKQAKFPGLLAQTRSVAPAPRAVGMSRQTAYRLRGRPGAESFAAAWDRALGQAKAALRKVAVGELARRATEDLLWPLVHRGRFRQVVIKHDNASLLRMLAQARRGDPKRFRDPAADDKIAPSNVIFAPPLTSPAHPPTDRAVCGAVRPNGPPLAPSPVEGRSWVTLAG